MNKYVALLLLIICGCSQDSNNDLTLKYFDVNGLIENQIVFLYQKGAKLQKTATINSEREENVLEIDSTGWIKELGIFRDVDLNRNVYLKAYQVVEGASDPGSNLKSYIYEPINSDEVLIKYLKIFFVNDSSEIRRLEAEIYESNSLFKNQKFFKMEFDRDGFNNLVLQSYQIEGYQKMITMDTVRFSINGIVLL